MTLASMPAYCPVCRNPTMRGDGCLLPECQGRTPEQWALHDAHADYTADRIDTATLERRVERALTAPPRRTYPQAELR
jgi:hypothetical protein